MYLKDVSHNYVLKLQSTVKYKAHGAEVRAIYPPEPAASGIA